MARENESRSWTNYYNATTGRFAGQLFGERDSWAANSEMTFHTLEQARGLLKHFDIEDFTEIDEKGQAVSGPKHWHFYNIIAKKTMNNK